MREGPQQALGKARVQKGELAGGGQAHACNQTANRRHGEYDAGWARGARAASAPPARRPMHEVDKVHEVVWGGVAPRPRHVAVQARGRIVQT